MRIALTTERLDLRLFDHSDLAELHAIMSDPASNTIGDGPYTDIEQTAAWIARRRERHDDDGLGWYAVRLRSSGELVGSAGVTPGRTGVDEPEIGYLVGAGHRRVGYATEAATGVLDELLRERATVWATIRPGNAVSIRIVESLGFVLHRSAPDRKGELLFFRRTR